MLNSIKRFFGPPQFEGDVEKTQSAFYLNATLWISMLLLLVLTVSVVIIHDANYLLTSVSLLVLILAMAGLQFVMRLGYVKLANIFTLLITWAILINQARLASGIYDTAYIGGTVIVILLAGLLLDFRYSVLFAILSILVGWAFAYFQTIGAALAKPDEPYNLARDYTVTYALIGLVSYFTIDSLRKALERSRTDAIQLSQNNSELQVLRTELEKRVEERTSEAEARSAELADRTVQLELANIRTQKRAAQLQAISEVSRVIAQVRKLNDLLPRIVGVISEQFGFYHTAIFMMDEAGQFAVLSSASSQGGKQMMARGHRLKVGAPGVVGHVITNGEARIAFDDTDDIGPISSPDLPNTRSELTVPLLSGRKIIGALDIQSEQPSAFVQDDIDVIQILADQVSIAIENARLFDATQKSLSEAETIYRQYIRSNWDRLGAKEKILGFRYTVAGATPLENRIDAQEMKQAISTGQVLTASDDQSGQAILAVPIKLREEVIGVLNIRTPGKRKWSDDEIGLVRAVAERVAVSAENARLFDETTSRAERESSVSEITSRIRSTNDPNEMIMVAINELRQKLNVKDVRIVPYHPPQNGNGKKEE